MLLFSVILLVQSAFAPFANASQWIAPRLPVASYTGKVVVIDIVEVDVESNSPSAIPLFDVPGNVKEAP